MAISITYRELQAMLNTLTPEQLDQSVVTYSGDIDDTISVIGFDVNSDEVMGESLDTFPATQMLLILE
jgi:hypothetical protein